MEKRRWAEAASEGRCGEIEQAEGVRETVKEQWHGQLRKVGKDAEWTVCAARTRQMVEADARALSNGGFTQVTMVDLAAWQASKDAITGQELDHSCCRHLLTYPFVLWQIFLGRSSTSIPNILTAIPMWTGLLLHTCLYLRAHLLFDCKTAQWFQAPLQNCCQ